MADARDQNRAGAKKQHCVLYELNIYDNITNSLYSCQKRISGSMRRLAYIKGYSLNKYVRIMEFPARIVAQYRK